MRSAIWLPFWFGVCGCGASEPTAGPTEVPPLLPSSPSASPSTSPSASATIPPVVAAVESDGCLVVAEPYQLDFPQRKLEQPERRRDTEDVARPRLSPCTADDRSADCRFYRGREHFEALRFDLAAQSFREVALEGPPEVGPYAAQLALESLNLLGTWAVPRRTACFELIAKDNEKYLALYCGRKPLADEDTCDIFARVQVDLRRTEIEKLVRAADAGPPEDSIALYEQAGDGYRALFKDACEGAPGAAKRRAYRCEELIYNAYRYFRAARRVVKANEARSTLLDPRHGLDLDRTELAKRVAKEPPLTPE
jgi:hypothetical protein